MGTVLGNNLKVSIIVPVYNKACTIKACVDSLLNQSESAYEVILVNDGSTDSSAAICDEYADNVRCRVIHQENAGPSRARNVGLRLARSEYVAFVDADDEVSSNFVETLTIMPEIRADLVISGKREPRTESCTRMVIDSETALKELLYGSGFICCPWGCEVWGKLYRRDRASELGFDETLWMAEDLDFNYRYIKESRTIILVDCRIYYHAGFVFGSLTNTTGNKNKSPILVAERIHKAESSGSRSMIRASRACVTAFSLYYFQLLSETETWSFLLEETKERKKMFSDVLYDPNVSGKIKCKLILFKVSKRIFFSYYRIRKRHKTARNSRRSNG